MAAKLLDGLKVLDLTHAMAGPFCTQRLGDMGASIVKVEPPTGDHQRYRTIANARIGDYTTVFLSLNRNKRSISIDLKNPEGLETFYRLVKDADVVTQNFRPNVVRRLKIDYETLKSINPGIIYCSISGYGEEGPYVNRPGQDLVVQGYSGLMFNVGSRNDLPAPAGVFAVDVTASHLMTEGILAAYIHKLKSGEGQKVDINMLEGILDHQIQEVITILNTNIIAERTAENLAHTYIGAPYGVYKTRNGYMTMAMTDIPKLGQTVGNDELANMTSWRAAVDHRDRIVHILRGILTGKTTEEWIDLFDQADIWCGPVRTLSETLQDPQLAINGFVKTVRKPGVFDLKLPVNPIRFSGMEPIMTAPPALGEHTRTILSEAGFTEDQVQELLDRKAVLHTQQGNVVPMPE